MTDAVPIIDCAKPRQPSRYPVREWIIPLLLFLLPLLINCVALTIMHLR